MGERERKKQAKEKEREAVENKQKYPFLGENRFVIRIAIGQTKKANQTKTITQQTKQANKKY